MRAQIIIDEFKLTSIGDMVRDDLGWWFGATNNFVPSMGERYLNNPKISIKYLNADALPELIYICRNGI
jgi:hypothetical protein